MSFNTELQFNRYVLDPNSEAIRTKWGKKIYGPSKPAPIVREDVYHQIIERLGESEGDALTKTIHDSYQDKRAQIAGYTQLIPTVTTFLALDAIAIGAAKENSSITTLKFALAQPVFAWMSIAVGRITEYLSRPLVDRAYHAYSDSQVKNFLTSEGIKLVDNDPWALE